MARRGGLSAVAAVVVATAFFVPFREHLGREQWGWPYLLVVGSIAGTAGIGPALLAAVLAFLAWNFFFFPPYYTLRVAQTGDLVHLGAFLLVATAVGLQTGRLREREDAALRRERHLSALNRLSARLVSDDSEESMSLAVAEEVATLLDDAEAVVWTPGPDGQPVLSRPPAQEVPVGTLRHAALAARDEALTCLGTPVLPLPSLRTFASAPAGAEAGDGLTDTTIVSHALCAGGNVEGVLQVLLPSDRTPLDERDAASLASTAHLVAAFLRTRRLSRDAMRIEAEREAERLRGALVSSVSHELKTPLASITAAVTDLADPEVTRSHEEVVQRLSAVSQDLDRLDSAIADLLDVSRLEARAWRPQLAACEPGEVLGSVIANLSPEYRARIDLDVDHDLPLVDVDFTQVARAIGHVLGNALRYSTERVAIRGGSDGSMVHVAVEDSGPGIAEGDLPFIFDKFYRGRSGRESRSSTGLGLAITREIVTANRGRISVERAIPRGTKMVISLPVAQTRKGGR